MRTPTQNPRAAKKNQSIGDKDDAQSKCIPIKTNRFVIPDFMYKSINKIFILAKRTQYHDNVFYISADDKDAEKGEPDHIYRVSMDGEVSLFHTLTDLNDVGEIEGLSVDTQKGVLLIHANRGKRIVNGMPKGFYPGYDQEIHEVYTYPLHP